ncbi:ATP-binding protein [Actinoplanes sp. GCM10030250]|uniref:ATP-binding protein n=1 Tax=Actinoplanes sp. GCM10030250 TaxID=3273376 RepID=UPI0036128948
MVRPPVRGRDAELAAVRAAVDDALEGRGGVLLVEGPGGMGKTRLLEEAAELARARGLRVGASRGDVDVALSPLACLLAALFGGTGAPLAGNDLPSPEEVRTSSYWVVLDLQSRLEQLGAPAMVCLDDLQWADPSTVEALRALLPVVTGVPVVWVLAYRPREATSRWTDAVDQLARAGATRVVLRELPLPDVQDIVADTLGGRPDPPLLALAAETHGVPFLLTELLQGLREEELVAVRDGAAVLRERRLPARLGESMRRRLEALGAAAVGTARAAAALGRSSRTVDLAAMLDTGPVELSASVDILTRAHIFDSAAATVMFRHDLIREAVLDSVPYAARRALIRHAATVLLRNGAMPVEVAGRLLESAEPGDDAAAAVLHAAARALAATDPVTAANLARRALTLSTAANPDRIALVAETAVLLHVGGRDAAARDFANEEMRRLLSPQAEAEVRLSVARMYSLPGDMRLQMGEAALELPGLDAVQRARHLAVMIVSLVASSQVERAIAVARDAQAAAAKADDAVARLYVEFGLLAVDEAAHHYDRLAKRLARIHALAADTGDFVPAQAAEWYRSTIYAHTGRLDEALAVASDGLRVATRDKQGWIVPRWDFWRGWILLQQGQVTDAGAVLEGAFASGVVASALAIPDAAGLAALSRVAIHTGNLTLAGWCADFARESLAQEYYNEARRQLVSVLAGQALARGDAAGARRELRAANRDPDSPEVLPVLTREVGAETHLVRLALAARDEELGAVAVRQARQRAERNPAVGDVVAAAAHAEGLWRGDIEALRTAQEHYRETARPMARASLEEDLAKHLLTAGAAEEAVAHLNTALELYLPAGATWDAQRVRARLRRLGVRRRVLPDDRPASGWESLSPSELQVVNLVARGLSNRDAAAQLFLSPHTISTHLRRAFAKLDVTSRYELARLASERLRDGATGPRE